MVQAALRAVSLLLAALTLLPVAMVHAEVAQRVVTDSAGRHVHVPQSVTRVLAAGPPASILLYTLAPEKMIGWVRAPTPAEKPFLLDSVRDLPAYGRLTGRGGSANIETVIKFKPDLIIDVGSTRATYVSLADSVQEQTRIPYLLLDGTFDKTAQIYRMLGDILGVKDRAEKLAAYTETTLALLRERLARLDEAHRPRVYYARGANGLQTGLDGSINMEILQPAGALNAAAAAGRGGLTQVSLEQVLSWSPDIILTLDPAFNREVRSDPNWASIKAVREGRIYQTPTLPYGWFDSPPGVNRLIGVRWLASIFHPREFPEDMRAVTREFYRLFYHVDLTEAQLDVLLKTDPTRH
jgi:iron complex transport system substrate-binding protein